MAQSGTMKRRIWARIPTFDYRYWRIDDPGPFEKRRRAPRPGKGINVAGQNDMVNSHGRNRQQQAAHLEKAERIGPGYITDI
jgi:hypothetical protein